MRVARILNHVLNQLDGVFHALADSTRRTIVERLTAGDLSVGDLARPLPMSLPAVLQHVRVLESTGLVRTRKTGRVRTCSLDRAVFTQAEAWFLRQRAEWNDRLDRLGAFVESADDDSANSDSAHSDSAHDDKEQRS